MADQFYQINAGDVKITDDLLTLKTDSDYQIIPLAHGNFLPILFGAIPEPNAAPEVVGLDEVTKG